ncbi:hypothetical protein [Streptomyces sp. DvalAA-14]|uniref:hypothetical protein n=1 Tax=Streptomyces sp. DvalAA-14 TaxID=1839759 RepID=UPI00351E6797
MGFDSGQTCWRRLYRWQKAGVFGKLHRLLLTELNAAGELVCPARAWTALTSARKRGEPRLARRRTARPTTTATRVRPGRQGVRLQGRTPEVAAPQDLAGDPPHGRPEHQGPGKAPLRRRADLRLLHQFKRLAIRWERRLELHDAFPTMLQI